MMPVATEDKQTPVESQDAASRPRFSFPLPFDPVRLVAGMLAKWPLIIVSGACGLAAGVAAGVALTKPSYTLTASLMKRRVPENVQTGNTGQAYRPADLNDATLLATLSATDSLDRALARANNGIAPSAVRPLIETSQKQGTDFFYLTYHSPISSEDAVRFVDVWLDEINEYTKRLQSSDARSVHAILQKEVTEMEGQLAGVNRQILDFSNDKQFLGTNTQVTAALGELGQITRDLETARSTLKAKDEQIEALTSELRRQSPIDAQLKAAREEIATLRATYTDENPLVKAKLQGISYLEGRISESNAKGPEALEFYTGTDIGNQLFLNIISLRNERTEAEGKVASYTELKKGIEARVKELPAIVSRYEELQKFRESIMSSLSLLSNRLKETEIFSSGSPGYWQIFEGPELRKVEAGSKTRKPLLLGIAGGAAGTLGGSVLLLLLTTRSRRRSVLECCSEVQAPLLAELTAGAPEDSVFDTLWVSHFISRLRAGDTIMVWTAVASSGDERSFWSGLTQAARRDGISLPRIVDLTPDDLWTDHGPTAVPWTAALPGAGGAILRASRLPSAEGRQIFSRVSFWFALATGQADCLGRSTRIRELSSTDLSEGDGTVAFIDRPKNSVRRAGDNLSSFLARHFSRPPAPPKS
ncbi:MAG: hypothetical protein JWO82_1453 [Akkermansiaceae bacterium]|nr:hypothetical protein [Akkermansiaceae bacterium]